MIDIYKRVDKLLDKQLLLQKAYHNDTSLEEAKEIFKKVYEKKGD